MLEPSSSSAGVAATIVRLRPVKGLADSAVVHLGSGDVTGSDITGAVADYEAGLPADGTVYSVTGAGFENVYEATTPW
ncbi:MAG: hypothetical protein ACRDTV_00650 [Mycobacterium sp.]